MPSRGYVRLVAVRVRSRSLWDEPYGNYYLAKALPEHKIDTAIGLITAIGHAMETPVQPVSIFDRVEFWTT